MKLLPLLLLIFTSTVHANPPAAPNYSKIVQTLESQPVVNAQLIYWDQSGADALGIHTPPGRVGIPEFDRAVLKKNRF